MVLYFNIFQKEMYCCVLASYYKDFMNKFNTSLLIKCINFFQKKKKE